MHLRRRRAAAAPSLLHASLPSNPPTHKPPQLLCITAEGQCAGEEAKGELIKVCGLRGVSLTIASGQVLALCHVNFCFAFPDHARDNLFSFRRPVKPRR